MLKLSLKSLKNIKLVFLGLLLALSTSVGAQNQNPKTGTVFDDLDTSAAASTAREAEIAKLQKEIATFIDQLADIEMYYAASQTRRVGKNPFLVDSMSLYYETIGIDFLTIANMNIDKLWANAWSSKKAYSVNGKIDTTLLSQQTARQVVFRIKVDSTTSMKAFKVHTSLTFSPAFTELLLAHKIDALALQNQINQHLKQGINKLTVTEPREFRDPVIANMSWMYQLFSARLTDDIKKKLLELKEKENTQQENWPAAFANFQVKFSPSQDITKPSYGFDAYQNIPALEVLYQKATLSGNAFYHIPYASNIQKSRQTETVLGAYAKVEFINAKNPLVTLKDSIVFRNQSGDVLQLIEINGNTAYIAFEGVYPHEQIIAYYKGNRIGKLKVESYSPKNPNTTLKLHLVPVGTAKNIDVSKVKQELDEVYKQVLLSWDVTTDASSFEPSNASLKELTVPDGKENYSDAMNALSHEYLEKHPEIEKSNNSFVVFVVDKITQTGTGEQWNGYMPRGKSLGFVDAKSITELASASNSHTLAHELAHGGFDLQHTFAQNAQKIPPAQNTTNLMDYHKGKTLLKKQWDWVHSTNLAFRYRDDVYDGASVNGGKFTAITITQLKSDIAKIISNPDIIRQGETNWCGAAAAIYLAARLDPVKFEKNTLEIYNNGFIEGGWGHIDLDASEQMLSQSVPYFGIENSALFIQITTFKNEYSLIPGELKEEDFGDSKWAQTYGITTPAHLMAYLTNYHNIEYKEGSSEFTPDFKFFNPVNEINDLLTEGYLPLVIVDFDRFRKKQASFDAQHWMVVKEFKDFDGEYEGKFFNPNGNNNTQTFNQQGWKEVVNWVGGFKAKK